MPKSRFTASQITGILEQKEAGTPVRKLCCEHDISNATIYTWHKRRLLKQIPPFNPMKTAGSESLAGGSSMAATNATASESPTAAQRRPDGVCTIDVPRSQRRAIAVTDQSAAAVG